MKLLVLVFFLISQICFARFKIKTPRLSKNQFKLQSLSSLRAPLEFRDLASDVLSSDLTSLKSKIRFLKKKRLLDDFLEKTDHHKRSLLHFAAETGDLRVLKYLLEDLKMDPLKRDYRGLSVFSYARSLEAKKLLDSYVPEDKRDEIQFFDNI